MKKITVLLAEDHTIVREGFRNMLELETDLRQLVSGLTRNATGALEVSRLPAEPRFLEPLSGMYWQIVPQPAGPVLRSRSL